MEQKKKIEKKEYDTTGINRLITTVIILVIVLFLIFGFLFFHNREYSENENRYLSQAPTFTWENLFSGQFMTDVEDFVADQIPLRDQWIRLKYGVQKLTGQKESNGVYICKKGYLMEVPEEPDAEGLARNLAAINTFADTYPDLSVYASIVPNAAYVCDQLVPKGAPAADQGSEILEIQEQLSEHLTFINVTAAMQEHKTEAIYYRSDHHWTSLGAYYAFQTIGAEMGLDVAAVTFTAMPVTTRFSGTLASESGGFGVKDPIDIYVAEDSDLQYTVQYSDDTETYVTMYQSSALQQKNKYEVFLGGNHAKVTIETTADSDKSLLLIRDSYSNTFVQFLLPYYNKIILIDPRYYSDEISSEITNEGITDVLILYNMNTFGQDTSLYTVLEP